MLTGLGALVAGGLLAAGRQGIMATLDIRPYAADDADFLVVSDLGSGIGGVRGPYRTDHVLGVGGASTTLARPPTVRPPVARALDLGTGCGIQALHLSRHAASVVGTDTNRRALAMAGLTAALNDVELDLRAGSLFEPVAGERFDLVVSNPPFVVSPAPRFSYRDGGFDGDDLCRDLVGGAPDHLADGGWCRLLANWLHVRGQDWRERVAGWVVPTGCDALVLQREVMDPMEYAELWLRDSGEDTGGEHAALYDAWLDWFERHAVEGVGLGWVTLRAGGAAHPYVRIEDLRQPVDQPVGGELLDWFERHDRLQALYDDALLAGALVLAPDVHVEQESAAAPGGGLERRPARVRQASGLRRSGGIDAVGVGVLAAADGRRPLGTILDEVAAAHGVSPADLEPAAVAAVRSLIEEGFLRLPGSDPQGSGPVAP